MNTDCPIPVITIQQLNQLRYMALHYLQKRHIECSIRISTNPV